MRAVAFPRGIEWQKLLQFVISSNSIIAKRAFGVLCIIRKSNSYTDILHGHPRLKTFSNNEGKSLYSSEASDNLNKYSVTDFSHFSYEFYMLIYFNHLAV